MHRVGDLFFPVAIYLSKGIFANQRNQGLLGTGAELERSALPIGKKNVNSVRTDLNEKRGCGGGGCGSLFFIPPACDLQVWTEKFLSEPQFP